MDKTNCAACNNELISCGDIPQGVLLICSHCGSKKIYIDNYDLKKDNTGYGNAYRGKIKSNKSLELITLFEKKCTDSKHPNDLLDIGFGSGEFLLTLKEKGFNVSGLECDINSIKLIRQRGITAYYGELGRECSIEQQYHFITLWDVLEHINDIETALVQLNALIRKGGKLIILTPNADSLFDFFASIERSLSFRQSQRIMSICLNKYHLHRFTIKGLKILLERFGFEIDHFESLQLFSLNSNVYTDGFAPGILKWTNYSTLNELMSKVAMIFIKTLNIKNKIFLTAVKK